jgi:hypothetical protein
MFLDIPFYRTGVIVTYPASRITYDKTMLRQQSGLPNHARRLNPEQTAIRQRIHAEGDRRALGQACAIFHIIRNSSFAL